MSTARWAAALRAEESGRADRLFVDPLAAVLAGDEGRAALAASVRANPRHDATAAFLAIRTRYFDDLCRRSAGAGIRQVVTLAAGMDARAFRLGWPEGTVVYELDYPGLLQSKDEILARVRAVPRCRRVAIGTDLKQPWTAALEEAGFSVDEPTLWLAEGVLYYLIRDDVVALLESAFRLSACGSRLGADLVSESYLTSPLTQPALAVLAERDMGGRFGTDEPESFLAETGWNAEVRQPGEDGVSHGRWPHPLVSRDRKDLPHAFLVAARKRT